MQGEEIQMRKERRYAEAAEWSSSAHDEDQGTTNPLVSHAHVTPHLVRTWRDMQGEEMRKRDEICRCGRVAQSAHDADHGTTNPLVSRAHDSPFHTYMPSRAPHNSTHTGHPHHTSMPNRVGSLRRPGGREDGDTCV